MTVYAGPGAAWLARRWHLTFVLLCFVYLLATVRWDMSIYAQNGFVNYCNSESY
jgi:DNA-binding transcriptional regulator of glucitol operon